jgi:acetylornithine deacetylase
VYQSKAKIYLLMITILTPPSIWLTRFVQIPSVNLAHAGPRAGVVGEARIATQLAEWFRECGADEVITEDVYAGRPNVYGIWRAPDKNARWLAVDCHTDTVGVETMEGDPFSGEVRDGKVFGRGSVDDKASLAVWLSVLETLHQQDKSLPCNLILGAVVNEEHLADGAVAFANWLQRNHIVPDEMLVAEPTMCAPCYGHKGVMRQVFTVQGVSTHTSQPELGKNAILSAMKIVQAMDTEHQRLQSLAPSPVGHAKLTVSIINGGYAPNIVPDQCAITIDRRVVAGERAADVAVQLQALAERASDLPVRTDGVITADAFYQAADSDIVRRFAEWSGMPPVVVPYGSDAFAYVNGVVRNCVVLGPGSIDQAHGAVEWVAISELEKLAQIYARWLGV